MASKPIDIRDWVSVILKNHEWHRISDKLSTNIKKITKSEH